MRVAVVVSTYPPYRGGMGNAAAAHAEALASAGHDVTVFSPGVNLRPLFRIGNSACAPQLWWRLRGFDAVELHYPFFGGAEWVWLWKLTFGRKARLAVMYHMDAVGSGFFGAVFRVYRAIFLKPILRSADAVLTASKDYLASSQAAFIAGDARVRETPFGVDVVRFRPRPDLKQAEPLALFVGGLDRAHYFKGVPVLLEAFSLALKAAPDAYLAIVGDGDLRKDYERKAKELGIETRVRFVGKATDDRLQECYGHARCHVLPSVDRSEAFGIVTLEASASGIPSIVSDLPGVRTVVQDGVTGLVVPPGDAAALSRAMTDLFLAKDRAETMGRAARARAERLYARETTSRAVVEALTR